MRDPRISSERMTSVACPEQWEGSLRDGLRFYFRYRSGYVTLGIGETAADAISAASREDGYTGTGRSHGDSLQGCFEGDRDEVFTSMLDEMLARWRQLAESAGGAL